MESYELNNIEDSESSCILPLALPKGPYIIRLTHGNESRTMKWEVMN